MMPMRGSIPQRGSGLARDYNGDIAGKPAPT